MKSNALVNYLAIAIASIFLWFTGLISIGLIGASLELSIHSILTIFVAYFLLRLFFKTIYKAKDYKTQIGLKFIEDLNRFLTSNKFELIIAIILYIAITNKNFIPNNPILDLLSLFINSVSVVSFKLSTFFSQNLNKELFVISDLFTVALQLTFAFLIVQAIASIIKPKTQV